MEKLVSMFLRVVVSESLENIPPELWATCFYSAIARAWDKFFSLCANYHKGQGEHFAMWLRVNKPGIALYHTVGVQGLRHDLCLMAALAIYMNRYVCFGYASYLLRLQKKPTSCSGRNQKTCFQGGKGAMAPQFWSTINFNS